MSIPIEEFGELIAIFVRIQKHNNDSIREKIENDGSYTPYAPYSPADDVTYEQIIELMGHLPKRKCPFDRKREKIIRREMEQDISSCFHWQARFHAIAQSFHSESIEKWDPERKLQLWILCEESLENALGFAKKTRDTLEKYVD